MTITSYFSGPSDDSETASKRPKLDLSLTSAPKVDKVGTVNPSEDFLALLQSGLSFASIVVQLEDVIFRLFTESFEDSFIQKGRSFSIFKNFNFCLKNQF